MQAITSPASATTSINAFSTVASPLVVSAGTPNTAAFAGGGAVLPAQQGQLFIFPRQPPKDIGRLASFFDTVAQAQDLSATFWKPDPSRGESGLLSALVKRHAPGYAGGGANDEYMPVFGRPALELANNYSNAKSERVDLSHPRFQFSRATQTMSALNQTMAAGDATVRMADVQNGLREGIPLLQTDEYYLVKYRDYSDFAVTRWNAEARRDRMMSPLFVERFFAIRVGSLHGVFIPITESQFERGNELLNAANISPEAVAKGRQQIALSVDQFKSLGTPSAEFNPNMRQPGDAANGAGGLNDDDLDLPPPPHAFDWSSQACNVRWRRFKRQHYHNIGRYTLKIAVVGAVAVYIKFRFFPGPATAAITNDDSRSSKKRLARTNGQIVRDIFSLPITLLGSALIRDQDRD